MISIRRATERWHERRRRRDTWNTFPVEGAPVRTGGFGSLELLAEDRLPPAAVARAYARDDDEIITYVREGALSFEDSLGHGGVLQAGEFQRTITRAGVHRRETNPSRTDWAHVFRLWLRPWEADLSPECEQQRFSVAERRARLRVVAACDGRKGALRIHQDVLVYSGFMTDGQHVVYALGEGRIAWLHLVEGEATVDDFVLTSGDGAGYSAERAVSFRAQQATEVLLIDLGGASNPGLVADRAQY